MKESQSVKGFRNETRSPNPLDLLPSSFYHRPSEDLGPDLLGRYLHRQRILLRITEVEAYVWPHDSANHCHHGRTKRNAPMWGRAGQLYVYLCYGIHQMLNVVSDAEGRGAAVLIRSCEIIAGGEDLELPAGDHSDPLTLAGPGKIGRALALDQSWNEHPLFVRGGLELLRGIPPSRFRRGPRIGIDSARPRDRRRALRFCAAASAATTKPNLLTQKSFPHPDLKRNQNAR